MDDIYNNINNYKPTRKRKILIVFDDMITDIMTNKKFQAIIKELFIRCRKLDISLVFIKEFCFSVPKEVRLNSSHCLIMNIYTKRELQQITINHSADIDYKDFVKIYSECTSEPFSFLTMIPHYQLIILQDLEKIFYPLIKMTLADELKIPEGKVKANHIPYDLDREAPNFSALLSTELYKYEYVTGKVLEYKPGVVEQTEFEYSPLGKAFNKGLKKEDKKRTFEKT